MQLCNLKDLLIKKFHNLFALNEFDLINKSKDLFFSKEKKLKLKPSSEVAKKVMPFVMFFKYLTFL